MTGISRKEIKSLQNTSIAQLSGYSMDRSPGAQLLAHWYFDPEYLDSNKLPKVIPYEGETCSFSALVKAYGGDVPIGAMRTELLRVHAIEELENGTIGALKRFFVPDELDERLVLGLDSIIHSNAATLDYNCNPENQEDLRIQQLYFSRKIGPNFFDEIKRNARTKLYECGQEFDDYITRLENESGLTSETETEVGIGLYYYEIPATRE